jgi:thiosulfate reductase cytochrome b subunit
MSPTWRSALAPDHDDFMAPGPLVRKADTACGLGTPRFQHPSIGFRGDFLGLDLDLVHDSCANFGVASARGASLGHVVRTTEQPAVIRLAHWLNLPLLVCMAGSGLQIFAAYPFLGPRGRNFAFYPFQGDTPPEWLRLGGWLAGARALHFAFAWFFVANGLVYLAYLFASGEFRERLFFPRRDGMNAYRTAVHYLRLGPAPSSAGLYNGLQRLAYTTALLIGALLVLSGLAIWKPVQLASLAALLGGYDFARTVHLGALTAMALFTVGHVIMALSHPRSMKAMIAGGERRRAHEDVRPS